MDQTHTQQNKVAPTYGYGYGYAHPEPDHPFQRQHYPNSHFNQNQNQNQNPCLILNPSSSLTHHNHFHGGYATQTTAYGNGVGYDVSNGGLPMYSYQDPNWVTNVANEVYGDNPFLYHDPNRNATAPSGMQQVVTANLNYNQGTKHNSSRKGTKKIKIPQPIRCDVCKIVCDTKDVLDKHRLGRKHKKNLEKLKAVVAGVTTAPISRINSATFLQNSAEVSQELCKQTKKKKQSLQSEDLETKRRKVVGCGAAMDAVRTCTICEVVCNSETVFQSHLSGQKHAAMVKRQASRMQSVATTS